jgi:D-alanyl-D-alanine dipeptidase
MRSTINQIRLIVVGLCLTVGWASCHISKHLPRRFVYLQKKIHHIAVDLRYFSSNNFVGDTINGYLANHCIITRKAAYALKKVEKELNQKHLGLKIFDAYRPQQAVDHFVQWAEDHTDTTNKTQYYPKVAKNRLFQEGYISARSGHSRGSTVDLTIIYLRGNQQGTELDMGTSWDYFSPRSWPSSNAVSAPQKENRMLLQRIMVKNGFKPIDEEWWHFTLHDEPFPETYFNFIIR